MTEGIDLFVIYIYCKVTQQDATYRNKIHNNIFNTTNHIPRNAVLRSVTSYSLVQCIPEEAAASIPRVYHIPERRSFNISSREKSNHT
jgi:hypothetical protein